MFDMIPFKKNNSLRGDDFFSNLFNNFFEDNFMMPADLIGTSLRVDLKETDDSYLVEADLPGVQKDAINIEYNNHYLTISAKRNDSIEDKQENYVRRERHYGELRRSFYVDNVDEAKIDASFKDGVLKVTLPKQQKGKDQNRRIEIH
jgi:Molecular chaperone (small heat shock protein)